MKLLRVILCGMGQQTVALCALAANKDERLIRAAGGLPDAAVFSDPGWERPETYAYLKWFRPWLADRGLRLDVVSTGNIKEDLLSVAAAPGEKRFASIPAFTSRGGRNTGILRRQCTRDYKINAIIRHIRESLLGLKKGRRAPKGTAVEELFGISREECHRMRSSEVKWITNRYPLIDMGWDRGDCVRYIEEIGLPVPVKSACVGCPFQSNLAWREMKESAPEAFGEAVAFDAAIRRGFTGKGEESLFLHRQCVPLDQADVSDPADDLFGGECAGVCGV
jgi:hypothetical protein